MNAKTKMEIRWVVHSLCSLGSFVGELVVCSMFLYIKPLRSWTEYRPSQNTFKLHLGLNPLHDASVQLHRLWGLVI